CFAGRFGVPLERAVGELDPPAVLNQWPEKRRHLLALSNRVRGDKRKLTRLFCKQCPRLHVPASHVVHVVDALGGSPYPRQIRLLLFSFHTGADKWRVAE